MNSFVKAFAAVTVGLFAPQHVAAADEIAAKEKMILLPSADAEGAINQVTGTGPFGVDYVNPADDPSHAK